MKRLFRSPWLEVNLMLFILVISYIALGLIGAGAETPEGGMSGGSIAGWLLGFFLLSFAIAMVAVIGGIGGGWRQQYRNSSTISRYPAYNTQGTFGGDGGFGRLVVQYRTSLNNGATLFNRGGMEHVAFDDINRRYTVLAGSARASWLGGNDGGNYSSTWYDLESVSPVVTNLSASTIGPNTSFTLQGEGAQSHPHNQGSGTGEPDPNNVSGLQDPSTDFLNGWRFFRFAGAINRTSSDPTAPPPVLDDIDFPYVTDDI